MNHHASLIRFAQANDAAAATSKKLQKQAILADYFRGTGDDADLRLAVRYAGGRAFPSTDERVLNVGGALFRDAAAAVFDLPADEFRTLTVKSGEIGEALAAAWPHRRPTPAPAEGRPIRKGPPESLTLREVAAEFDEIARLGKRANKLSALVDLLFRATTPREAAYLGKIIFGDLRTGVQEGVLQAAVAATFDAPLAKVQRCQLLVGDLEEVAVMARHGTMDSAEFRLFHPIQFMLAAPQESPAAAAGTIAGRPFVAEDKLDGIRVQVHKSGDGPAARVALYTRTMDRADDGFPDVVEQVAKLPGDVLLDGEIVPYEAGVVLPFGRIQKRLGRKRPPAAVVRENPCAFIAFDALYADGKLLMDEPLSARRAALEKVCGQTIPALAQTPVTEETPIAEAFAAARDRRNEGVVLKDTASPYTPGRRGQVWLKLKTHLPTIDCVVTAAETGHGKRRESLSDYTFAVWTDDPAAEGAKLVNVGKAYSGVTDEEIATLTKLFTEITVRQAGRVRLVKPQVVLEIACDQIQRSARHAGGFALRFPRIKRIRWDKRPEDADRLARVAEIHDSHANFGQAQPAAVAVEAASPGLFDGL